MAEKSPMIFTDPSLGDDIVSVIEIMTNHHVAGNFQEVRNIILGYDPKNNKWISKYGERLSREGILYTENKKESHYDTDSFSKKGMIFYDDDVYEDVRIYMDDSVRRTLDVLFTLSKNVIEYRYIIDIIVIEWTSNNIRDSILSENREICYNTSGELRIHYIEMKESLWKELKSVCRNKGLSVKDGFKQAIIRFLDKRAEMLEL